MKQLRIIVALFLGTIAFVSCDNKESNGTDDKVFKITADRQSVTDIAAENPGEEVVVITTDAPYWMITSSPAWITADPVTAEGNGKSTIVTFTIESNKSTSERSGDVLFVGGKSTFTVTFTQVGRILKPTNDHYTSGAGTEDDPWTIENAVQLAHIIDDITDNDVKCFKLTADIDLKDVEWVSINAEEPYGFLANIDGNGKTISNLSAPLFYDLNGKVSNLTIANANIVAGKNAGVIARVISVDGAVSNVKIVDSEVSTDTNEGAGAVVAKIMNKAEIDNVLVQNCNIKANTTYAGGIVGCVDLAEDVTVNITRCGVEDGTVTAMSYYPAGIVGGNNGATGKLNIKNCYSSTDVMAFNNEKEGRWAGGILGGHNKAGSITNLENCYASGAVYSHRWGAGGIVGYAGGEGLSIVRCMAYNSLVKATNDGQRYGSGAVLGSARNAPVVVDKCYRSKDLVYENLCTGNTELFDMAFVSTPTLLTPPEDNPNAFFHHGQETSLKLSALVQDAKLVGEPWSSSIWDFSKDYPTLK
jgi:hypothetical protein